MFLYGGESCNSRGLGLLDVYRASIFIPRVLLVFIWICKILFILGFESERVAQPFVTIHDVRCNTCMRPADGLTRADHPARYVLDRIYLSGWVSLEILATLTYA